MKPGDKVYRVGMDSLDRPIVQVETVKHIRKDGVRLTEGLGAWRYGLIVSPSTCSLSPESAIDAYRGDCMERVEKAREALVEAERRLDEARGMKI